MKNKILVIGSINIDLVVNLLNMPKIGETIISNSLEMFPGGKGANQAYAASNLGADVTMLGCVGEDNYSKIIIDSLKNVNVNTDFIKYQKDMSTGMAIIYVDSNANNNIVVVPQSNYSVTKTMIDDNIELIKNSDVVMLQLEIPFETVLYIIEQCKLYNKTVVFNPAPFINKAKTIPFNDIGILILNETELEDLSEHTVKSENDFKIAINTLLEKGSNNIIVTRGEHGCIFANDLEYKLYESIKVKAIDTTAAGDTFCSSIAVCIAQNKSFDEAIKFATKASSITVTRKGAQPSIPSLKEVLEIL